MEKPWHITAELFRRMLWPAEARQTKESARLMKQAVRHLLHRCPQCTDLGRRLWQELREGSDSAGDFDQAFERALAFGVKEEREKALDRIIGRGQWAALEPLAPAAREDLVSREKVYHRWGLYKALLSAGRWYSRRDPREAVDLVALAIRVAELLDPKSVGGQEAAFDLQAAAWAILANTRRLASDFHGARHAIKKAWELHHKGTRDAIERAFILGLEAHYIRDLGEYECAEAVLDQVLIYRSRGDVRLQGRTLITMGDIIGYIDPARGVARLREGLTLIDPGRDPRWFLCAQHDLALFLNDAGQPDEALDVLSLARPLYRQFQDDFTQLRLHWLEARIARVLNHLTEAVDVFRHLWEEFRARDLHHEVVMVSLDLSEALVARGEYPEAAQLVAEVYPIMANWGLHRPALAAWLVLQKALELRRLNGLFSRIRLYYLRHWNIPADFEEAPRASG